MAGVLRFPNAVSDIGKFIETYCEVYNQLKDTSNFSHDDARDALISKGLVSSSGAIGQEAVRRSVRANRSKDPLYNQLKMYSEVYRMLGWYTNGSDDKNSKTTFNFSSLAVYLDEASKEGKNELFKLSCLNITFPNFLVENRGENILKPFVFLLKLMKALGGRIHRDEIILGVLSLDDDTNGDPLNDAVKKINALRGKHQNLANALSVLAKHNGVQENTLKNYTRFILGALKYTGWATPSFDKIDYKKKVITYFLTDDGEKVANELDTLIDVRYDDIETFSDELKGCFTYLTYFLFLERAGYNVSESLDIIKDLEKRCQPIYKSLNISNKNQILFSPFQQSKNEDLLKADEISEEYEKDS